MTRYNHEGKRLIKWVLKEEREDFYILQKPDQQEQLSYPKSTFKNEQEHFGATREEDVFYLPER